MADQQKAKEGLKQAYQALAEAEKALQGVKDDEAFGVGSKRILGAVEKQIRARRNSIAILYKDPVNGYQRIPSSG